MMLQLSILCCPGDIELLRPDVAVARCSLRVEHGSGCLSTAHVLSRWRSTHLVIAAPGCQGTVHVLSSGLGKQVKESQKRAKTQVGPSDWQGE
jgi:hypothetical protein